jgi:dTDP-D-glucose 4,6-dehydratase
VKRLLGYEPQTGFEDGLNKVDAWFIENWSDIVDLLRNNLEKPGERISVKRSNMRGAMDALEGSIS